jgi:hypothetical protein
MLQHNPILGLLEVSAAFLLGFFLALIIVPWI